MEKLPQSVIDAVANTEHEVLECNDSLASQIICFFVLQFDNN